MNTKTTIKIGFICILIMLFTGCCVTNVETSITEETFAPISEATSSTSYDTPEATVSPESSLKELTFVAGSHKVTVKCPPDWNELAIVYSDNFPQQHTGIQLFNGKIPEQLEIIDGKIFIASATSGFADGHLKDRYSISDFESFETSKGYKLKIYYGNDDFPEFALFEEYPDMCIFFDIESEEEIAEIVSIVNSIEIS